MRIIMLGTSAAMPNPDRHDSGILISVSNEHYLFDCGHGATNQIVAANVNPAAVGHVFLSHLHYDHIADFPYFMITTWMADRQTSPIVIGPTGTADFVDSLMSPQTGAYRKDIEARIQYPQRQANVQALNADIREMKPGVIFEDKFVRVSACYVEHIPREISPCFGLRLDSADGKSVVFSGDTAPCDRLIELAQGADLLIHECTFPQSAIDFRSKAGIGTWAHTSPTELGKIAVSSNVKSLIATHFGNFDSNRPVVRELMSKHMPVELMGPHLMEEMVSDIRKNWSGELRMAHDLMRVDL
jgi:ribonuclease Z